MMLQNLKFNEQGLIPVIIQDRLKGHVLAFSHMNAEALALTLQNGIIYCWNQIKQRVVRRTDDSGRALRVVDMIAEAEGDALIIKVDTLTAPHQAGEESHGRNSVADQKTESPEVSIVNMRSMEIGLMMSQLFQLIVELGRERPDNSYTAHLFESGLDEILKKLTEQIMETILAAKNDDQQELSVRTAELLYYLLVLMVERDLDLRDLLNQLRQRAGLAGQPLSLEPHNA